MKKKPREKCQWNGCKSESQYAIYRLYDSGNKYWGHYCNIHEKYIASENRRKIKGNPGRIYTEVFKQE